MPMTYALWNGGSSYAPADMDTDLETFPSLSAACGALVSRHYNRDGTTPCVEDSWMDVYFYDPREVTDPYPDRRLTMGPRGGVRVERC